MNDEVEDKVIREICQALIENKNVEDICNETGISVGVIRQIESGVLKPEISSEYLLLE